jgi:hypothetical protein
MTFTVIIGIILIMIILYNLAKKKRQTADEQLIRDIQFQYQLLNDIVISSYDLKTCPKCFEKKMSILNISDTGQSVEYCCEHCQKKIIGKLLPNKDGTNAAAKIKEIKGMFEALVRSAGDSYSKREIDISFIVNTPVDNLIENRQRTPIPESIRNEVWRRDQGKCVICGSQINLEFDHIIPFSKGGSNTARNLQLLCETCNRKKYDKI